jgi:hypothetical protein
MALRLCTRRNQNIKATRKENKRRNLLGISKEKALGNNGSIKQILFG